MFTSLCSETLLKFYSDLFCLLSIGVEGYLCTSSHSLTHAHLVGQPLTRDVFDAETSNILKLTWRKQTSHLVWVLVMSM